MPFSPLLAASVFHFHISISLYHILSFCFSSRWLWFWFLVCFAFDATVCVCGCYRVFIIRKWITMLIDIIFIDYFVFILLFAVERIGKCGLYEGVHRSMERVKKNDRERWETWDMQWPVSFLFTHSFRVQCNFEWSNLNNFAYELSWIDASMVHCVCFIIIISRCTMCRLYILNALGCMRVKSNINVVRVRCAT